MSAMDLSSHDNERGQVSLWNFGQGPRNGSKLGSNFIDPILAIDDELAG
jgi:hypothetical protein